MELFNLFELKILGYYSICNTFAFATETTVEELKNYSKKENTAKSTGFWPSVWNNWCVDKEITDEMENYEPAELNTLLEHFYDEVNNKKGEDYEPERPESNDGIA